MALDLESALGIHEQGLYLRSRRAEVLAANMANADTPNYLARDYDFRAALSQVQQNGVQTGTTHSRHIQPDAGFGIVGELLYRNVSQPSIDGNTVDTQREQVEFAQNAVRYQASLRFLSGKITALLSAIRGD